MLGPSETISGAENSRWEANAVFISALRVREAAAPDYGPIGIHFSSNTLTSARFHVLPRNYWTSIRLAINRFPYSDQHCEGFYYRARTHALRDSC